MLCIHGCLLLHLDAHLRQVALEASALLQRHPGLRLRSCKDLVLLPHLRLERGERGVLRVHLPHGDGERFLHGLLPLRLAERLIERLLPPLRLQRRHGPRRLELRLHRRDALRERLDPAAALDALPPQRVFRLLGLAQKLLEVPADVPHEVEGLRLGLVVAVAVVVDLQVLAELPQLDAEREVLLLGGAQQRVVAPPLLLQRHVVQLQRLALRLEPLVPGAEVAELYACVLAGALCAPLAQLELLYRLHQPLVVRAHVLELALEVLLLDDVLVQALLGRGGARVRLAGIRVDEQG
mmetsp:Transcript_39206/g.122677  ORF Transcript_39206/g.122677 Transcript_39206/m.122677 type:complete len:295 (-) Transcript_39206:407-1291(-)